MLIYESLAIILKHVHSAEFGRHEFDQSDCLPGLYNLVART